MNRLKSAAAALLVGLLVVAGLTVTASPAAAAPGDVVGATLSWGIKTSFTNYIQGPIAHGGWTVDGPVSPTAPFSWGSGSGAASQSAATGAVDYGGSIHFTGHDGALDLTFSDFSVVQHSATAASLVLDARYNSMTTPGEFTTVDDIEFATLDLALASNASDAVTVGFAAAPAVLTAAGAAAFAGFYAEGTALDPVTFSWPVEQLPVPAVSVSKTTGLHPGGESITVTGTGFLPNGTQTNATRPPLLGSFGGVYVVFGKFADTWQPSAGAPSSARKVGSQSWLVSAADAPLVSGTIPLNADGSFSITVPVSRTLDANPGSYGIYTYAGGGAVYAPFETATPITFETDPVVSVSKVQGLNPGGETITVKGWNFVPNPPGTSSTRPPLAGKFGGAYVVFGRFDDLWKPSAAAPSSARDVGDQQWLVAAADAASVGATPLNADGSFTVELDATTLPQAAGGTYGVYSYAGGGAVYAPFETATPVTFTESAATALTLTADPASGIQAGGAVTLTAQLMPPVPGEVRFTEGTTVLGTVPITTGTAALTVSSVTAGSHKVTATFSPADLERYAPSNAVLTYEVSPATVAAGSLTWGVKASFRDYVTGSIAKGAITTNGAGTSGGAFVFGQAAGATFDPVTGTGTSPYSGSVRFTGHGGVLDVTIANPTVRVDSASSGTLLVAANGAQVALATLDLAAGTRTATGNTTGWADVPATLTAAGSGVFAGFYPAGTALDPVTFVIGSPSTGGGTRTVATFVGLREPAAAPPATTGLTVSPESLKNLEAGAQITISAEGFEANEEDVLVVVYSEPVLLDRTAADASGVVTWTGRLPAGLTGEHTLTLQGSVNRGVVLNIPARIATAAEGCSVDDAALTWGFKETFRSYISGSIANGEWTVADGATYETPDFGWADGQGAYDTESDEGLIAFSGSIRFTGHGGVLDTTVANPQLRFFEDGTAVLLLDVSGVTQQGAPIDQKAVEFAALELADALELQDDTVTITAAPAVLTPAGAAAFGTYESGEQLDPVTATFTLPEDCLQPVVEETSGAGEPTASTGPDLGWLIWLIVGLAAVAAAVAAFLIVRSRRTAA